MNRCQQKAPILSNDRLQGEYYRVDMCAERMVPFVAPGQFVHVQLPAFEHRILRRPFSICDVDLDTGRLTVVYKIVGEGTRHLAGLPAGIELDVMGPLGNGYSVPPANRRPLIVGGGYGCAATYLFAKRCSHSPVVLLGGRTQEDLLLVQAYRDLGCDLRLSTDDGSAGHHGLVTDLLEQALGELTEPFVIACGPNPMLRAVGRIVNARGLDAELSLDHAMCCGVGACFACVVKLKADNEDGWEYVRTCRSGPVFKASRIYWDDSDSSA